MFQCLRRRGFIVVKIFIWYQCKYTNQRAFVTMLKVLYIFKTEINNLSRNGENAELGFHGMTIPYYM